MLINMVGSLDGKATVNGKAGSIGTPTDRVLMRSLRAHADAVMVGAGTIRAEKLTLAVPERHARARKARGLRPQPLAVVATASGDAPLGTNLLAATPDNLLVVASAETPAERLAALSSLAAVETVTLAGTATCGVGLDLSSVLQILKERYSVDVLLVEGGPRLNHSLVSLGLADEFFLTLAPKLLGGQRPGTLTTLEGSLLPPDGIEPKVVSVHLCVDELFLRYTLRSKEDNE